MLYMANQAQTSYAAVRNSKELAGSPRLGAYKPWSRDQAS